MPPTWSSPRRVHRDLERSARCRLGGYEHVPGGAAYGAGARDPDEPHLEDSCPTRRT